MLQINSETAHKMFYQLMERFDKIEKMLERQKRTVYPKKRTQRDDLCEAIDEVLKQKPKNFEDFVQALADMEFEFKDGKQPAFKGKEQKRFIRLRSLGEGYSKEELQAVISGKSLHRSRGGSAKAPAQKQFQMLIDVQEKMVKYIHVLDVM